MTRDLGHYAVSTNHPISSETWGLLWKSKHLSMKHLSVTKPLYHHRLNPVSCNTLHRVTYLELAVRLPCCRMPPWRPKASQTGPMFCCNVKYSKFKWLAPKSRSRRVGMHCQSWPLQAGFWGFSEPPSGPGPAGNGPGRSCSPLATQ